MELRIFRFIRNKSVAMSFWKIRTESLHPIQTLITYSHGDGLVAKCTAMMIIRYIYLFDCIWNWYWRYGQSLVVEFTACELWESVLDQRAGATERQVHSHAFKQLYWIGCSNAICWKLKIMLAFREAFCSNVGLGFFITALALLANCQTLRNIWVSKPLL